jgi:hypothetical protein
MAFHGFMIVKIPFHDKLFVSIHMHMPRRVIRLPPNKDVPASAEFPHSPFMLPSRVTFVNLIAIPTAFRTTVDTPRRGGTMRHREVKRYLKEDALWLTGRQ